jgi:hypothetical protein
MAALIAGRPRICFAMLDSGSCSIVVAARHLLCLGLCREKWVLQNEEEY